MQNKSFRITGQYTIAPSFKSISASGPERRPYLLMDEEVGREINKKGRNIIVTLDYEGGEYPVSIDTQDSNVTEADAYLVFLSFDHHRIRIISSTNSEVISKFNARALAIMNNVDSEIIYGVPKKPGLKYRCWVDDTGTLCHESLEEPARSDNE